MAHLARVSLVCIVTRTIIDHDPGLPIVLVLYKEYNATCCHDQTCCSKP